ncbi:hypothetical protein [Pseudonocardia zijingensis]|jgi:hypothetical protein|uniref:Uncharacterized protein n=1 Tax=Pseudonocardia zijingensis TaxID=153376 RepID=A0ABP4AKH9_9PSEU
MADIRKSDATSEAPAVLRPAAALAAELRAVAARVGGGCRYHEGARDALRWLLTAGPGPLTGRRTDRPLTLRAVVAELAAAETQLYGPQAADRDYAAGLEHAVMWAVSATPATPSTALPRPATRRTW